MSNLDLIRGRQVVEYLTNQSGGSVAAGDVVYIDTAHDASFTTGTTSAYTGAVGVAFESIASAAQGRVIVAGYCPLVNVNASVTRGNYGKTYTVAKQATDAGASRIAGTFCQWLSGGTTPQAHLFNVPDLGAPSTLGSLGYASVTANQGSITTEVDLTSLTVTATPASGRRIKVTCFVTLKTTVTNGPIAVFINEDGSDVQIFEHILPTLSQNYSFQFSTIRTPSNASHTWKLRASNDGGSGTVTLVASSTQPAWIEVEDIGT